MVLRLIVLNLVNNFVSFAPLGTVLVALLGVGVAERSGWLTAVIRGMVLNARPELVTVIIVLAGVLSNTASEMGYVVLVPLAAVVFYSLGRHPLAGLAAAFAGVSGGYSANLLIGTVDPAVIRHYDRGRTPYRSGLRSRCKRQLVFHDCQHIPHHGHRQFYQSQDRGAVAGQI